MLAQVEEDVDVALGRADADGHAGAVAAALEVHRRLHHVERAVGEGLERLVELPRELRLLARPDRHAAAVVDELDGLARGIGEPEGGRDPIVGAVLHEILDEGLEALLVGERERVDDERGAQAEEGDDGEEESGTRGHARGISRPRASPKMPQIRGFLGKQSARALSVCRSGPEEA